jgi:hypothetical protein
VQLLPQPRPGLPGIGRTLHLDGGTAQGGVLEACHGHADAGIVHLGAGDLARGGAPEQYRIGEGFGQVAKGQ